MTLADLFSSVPDGTGNAFAAAAGGMVGVQVLMPRIRRMLRGIVKFELRNHESRLRLLEAKLGIPPPTDEEEPDE